jgi:putative FmdB family regulatory protein
MPSYDLVCKACGNEFEITLHRFITDDDKVCPECSATDVEQKLSPFEWRGTRWEPTKGTTLPKRTVAKTRPMKPKTEPSGK